MLPIIRNPWVSVYIYFFALGGFSLFLYGFFPLKYHGGSEAKWSDLPYNVEDISVDGKSLYVGEKTRVVLMVIDAVRYDFVTSEYMPFTSSMISNGTACLYKAQAEAPTVTMPRIKAMTTGSVSNFIDVLLNLGSSIVIDDSFLNQGKLNDKVMVFYGDDTWLRLFPDVFTRSGGTASFFVNDFYEVDNNVTRNLANELPAKDSPSWDVLVLHYLGLDHIGHLEGPTSPRVKPKMKEMDDVVKSIITASENWSDETVFILCGDHGMKDSGSHGGTSYSEVTVPLVITQKKGCANVHPTQVDQIDIAPTISYLLGVPIPKGNTGQILPQVLGTGKGDLTSKSALYALYYNTKMNAEALIKTLGEEAALSKECYKQYLTAVRHHSDWLSDEKLKPASARMASRLYQSSLNDMSHYLIKFVVEFDMFAIIIGIIMLVLSMIAQFLVTIIAYQKDQSEKHSYYHHQRRPHYLLGRILTVTFITLTCAAFFRITCGISQTESMLCRMHSISVSAIAAIIVILVSNVAIIKETLKHVTNNTRLSRFTMIEIALIIGTAIYPITYGGTSFIEEEHQTWYYYWVTLEFLILIYTAGVLFEYIKKIKENATEIQDKSDLATQMHITGKWLLPQWAMLMLLHRFLRSLNQTGDKWAFLPDTADWLNDEDNKYVFSALVAGSIIWTAIMCLRNLNKINNRYKINSLATLGATLCIFYYRVNTHHIRIPYYDAPMMHHLLTTNAVWVFVMSMAVIEFWSSTYTFTVQLVECDTAKSKEEIGFPSVSYLGEDDNAHIAKSRHKHKSAEPESKDEDNVRVQPERIFQSCNKMETLAARTKIVINIVILINCLLLRPHNIILQPALCATSNVVNKILDYRFGDRRFNANSKQNSASKNILIKVLIHFWLGTVFYFYQGNSNSLASVDLGAGYVGLSEYEPLLVTCQIALHTYAGPLLAGLLVFADCADQNYDWDEFEIHMKELVATMVMLYVYPLTVYTVIAAFFRYHLFVWSVISPKLVYNCACMVVMVNIILEPFLLISTIKLQERINIRCKRKNVKNSEPKEQ